MFLSNQILFNPQDYREESVVKESRLQWMRINTQYRETTPLRVSMTRLFLQDEFINLDELTELEFNTPFKLEVLPKQPYEKFDLEV